MLNSKIKSSIDRLWDKFWSGGISNPLTAIEQISYLLFMKRIDHRGNRQVLTVEQRIELFKNSHTDWEIFSDRLHLGA